MVGLGTGQGGRRVLLLLDYGLYMSKQQAENGRPRELIEVDLSESK